MIDDNPVEERDIGSKQQRVLVFTDEKKGPIYRYPDGSLRTAKGYWFRRPPNAAPVFDSERSAIAVVRKAEIKQHRIETLQGEVRRTLKDKLKTKTAEQAGAKLVGNIIDIATDTDERAADRLASTKFALDAAGMKAKEAGSAPKITLEMTPEAVDRLYELSQAVDGEAKLLDVPADAGTE
jgi:hypothetical protein